MIEHGSPWKHGDNLSKQLSWLSAVFYLFRLQGVIRCPSISRYFELEGHLTESLQTEL